MEREGLENPARSTQRAQQNQQQAQESLKKGQPGSAQMESEEAKKDLERAKEDVDKKLEELKREAEEELMVHIETELFKVIEQQKKVNESTLKYDGIKKAKGSFTRQEGIEMQQLGAAQDTLSGICQELMKKLTEENVEVFRFILGTVVEDMTESTSRLRDQDPGLRTQEVQADILRKLTDLFEAFAMKLKAGKGGGGGQGGGKPPLVPDIVQVNLMKKMQQHILKRTQAYKGRMPKDGGDLPEADKAMLKRLSDEQGELYRIMSKFIEKFEKQAKGEGEGEREE
jgi:hypothetical protein